MVKLTKDDVFHVAKLAKLKLTSNEIEKFRKQLSEIMSYISKLNELNTLNIIPTSQTTGLENIFREDETDLAKSLSQEEATSGGKMIHNYYFVVPPVLDK
ncbi:hypothetical protein A3D00_04065 [Candidatus Woesebacteria bacterium RIFCSPHIGHO2_02_FULL_38_9]|uniref:Aspartyl/glutamyl-tRNA(Asn/Gln) amidotransferase subunit C n=1 Tax=Candidatus Woesebacteria bacterium RIFCSPHIGHO2_01_FULL_39_28 TaxID=1802496 RepID=A0A1F7YJ31_9BACT|nr:MAG: hypothetical protein A2627_03370 [Candidatus Woesebacteria bacterium RIFCSPHIGHO2_01_FULL_39_28]OGM34098.1 MAG: hypothetical protein A3D00_04065 [Candidatus Woesebacteria bacterium RIFCSPHIGHO2_02_FULL_38_9]OGM56971.1 MAG: hypothetical protein A3A50_03715 [Candidatus Woesebacteria bacterium RIFCSPLOWO2_01_FULL_38_20]